MILVYGKFPETRAYPFPAGATRCLNMLSDQLARNFDQFLVILLGICTEVAWANARRNCRCEVLCGRGRQPMNSSAPCRDGSTVDAGTPSMLHHGHTGSD